MFTGIVETVGEVVATESREEARRLRIRAPAIVQDSILGDSIAVDGVCLTVCQIDGAEFSFDVVRETLDNTALGSVQDGAPVNLERALRADSRLDGHIVQGHVDGVGRVVQLERTSDRVELHLECAAQVAGLLVDKGSGAVQGVSLTVVAVGQTGFHVALIPHTLEVTTLGRLQKGDRVNLEVDILGKYVARYLAKIAPEVGS